MLSPYAAVLGLALAAAACTGGIRESSEALETPSVTSSARASGSPSAGSIAIRAPLPDDAVISPVVVSGTAKTTTGTVLVRVLAGDGTELAAMNAPIDCGPRCRGTFRAALVFFVPSSRAGAVQVLEIGPGGSTEHLAEIPVRLVPRV